MGLHWKVVVIFLLNLTFAFSFELISNEEVLRRKPDKDLRREINQETTYVDDMMFLRSETRTSKSTVKSWPQKTIPYIISPNVTTDLRSVITKAIQHFHNYTCIIFRPRVAADTYWVRFLMKDNPGTICSSYVGFLNKTDQAVFLGPKCVYGSMVHELLHAVGFEHEHNRNDRDSFIKVHEENIAPEVKDAFIKECKDSTPQCTFIDYGVKYNYESIMHYCPRCATNGNGPAFTVLNNTKALGDPKKTGQRQGFSRGDWIMIKNRYNCTTTETPPPIKENADMQDPDDIEETPGVDEHTEDPPKSTTAGSRLCRPSICRKHQDCTPGCYCVDSKCSGDKLPATTKK